MYAHLASNTTDRQTVTAIAVHVRNSDVVATGNSNTVILVHHPRILQDHAISAGNIESIGIVTSGKSIGSVVGCIAS